MPEAGWYPDPHDPRQQRYWNGSTWTEHTHVPDVAPFAPPPPAGQPSASHGPGNQVNDIGEWLRQTFKIAWQKLGVCLGLTLVGLLPFVLVVGLMIVALVDSVNVPALVAAGIVALGAMVWFGIVTIAQYRVLFDAHRGRSIGFGQSLAVGRRNIGRLVVAYLIIYGIGLLAFAVIAAVIGAIVVAAGSSLRWEEAIERFLPLFNLLSLLMWPISLWLSVKLAFIAVAAAVAPRPDGVLRTSFRASNGRFWAVLGRMLLLSIVRTAMLFPLLIVVAIMVAIGAAMADFGGGSAGLAVVLAVLFGLAVGVMIYFAQILHASGVSRLYADLGGPAVE